MHRISISSGTEEQIYYAISLQVFPKESGEVMIWLKSPLLGKFQRLVVSADERVFIGTVED